MLDKDKLDWIYNKLFTIRFFEERIVNNLLYIQSNLFLSNI